MYEITGPSGIRFDICEDKEVVTVGWLGIGSNFKNCFDKTNNTGVYGRNCNAASNSSREWIPTPWNDIPFRSLVGNNGTWKKTAWRPGSGRHVNVGVSPYVPFTHIVRTLHLEDAVQVLVNNRMKPKNVITFSSLETSILPKDHPCKRMKILWFSAKFIDESEDDPNWYGNVEFAVPCNLLLEMFKYCFLVEMMTTPTHTVSRILLTNKDYSEVLPPYKKDQTGGGWKVTKDGQFALRKCSRYKFIGHNKFDHVLEFMLEVTAKDEKKILSNCKLSFKNHENAKDIRKAHVCNRYQRLKQPCPYPLSQAKTAALFRQILENNVDWKKTVYPKLSDHAKQYLPV